MWKNIYFECLSSGKHFLEQVLVSTVHQFGMLGCSCKVLQVFLSLAIYWQRKLNNVIRVGSFLQVTALDLIKHEEFSQLSHLLCQEFRPLARLLLLLGWTQCRSLGSARTLLSILHLEQVSAGATRQPTQTQDCHRDIRAN